MDFEQKYELIEPLPGEGPRSFRARQKGLGRDVTVHFLVGGQTPENQALLARLRTLPPNSLARLIEVGNNNGVLYVVTVAPPFQHLVEWLKDQEPAPVAAAPSTARAGMWKVPAMSPPAAAPPPTPPAAHQPPAPSAAEPGEFTRLFQTVPAPAVAPAPPAPPPVVN
ncbi:MAG: hypothetical protein WBL61_14225, partial [Bryobacteraceae bacterium]